MYDLYIHTRKLVYTDIPRYKTVLTNPAQEQRSQVLGDQALHPATCKAALCHEPVRSPWGRFASAWAQQGWQVDSKLRKFLTPKKVLKYKIFASSSMEHFDFECCIFKPSHRGSVMMIWTPPIKSLICIVQADGKTIIPKHPQAAKCI